MRIATWLATSALALAAAMPVAAQRLPAVPTAPSSATETVVALSELPKEARATLALIRKGGPYPYAKDGAVFGNREAQLPKERRGYYREYTVKTPGDRTRGARRIVAGRSGEYYYTDDHYNSFRRIREQ
jgi:ribonuclease T1